MKPSLQLRIGQQITMTPQLQQAIRLLQLSTLELQTEIQQALESNIMLEVAEEDEDYDLEGDDTASDKDATKEEESYSDEVLPNAAEAEVPEEGNHEEIELDKFNDIPSELTLDTEWEDVFEGANTTDHSNNGDVNGKDFLLNQKAYNETLQDYLRWQLELTPFNQLDHGIALTIIDGIDEDGYLRISLEEIKQSLIGQHINSKEELQDEEIEVVLHRLQQFDPIGVGARDLKECLLAQLNNLPIDTPWLKEAKMLVNRHLELLGAHDYTQLAKRLKIERDALIPVVELIQNLNPRPGAQLELSPVHYVVPDVFVKKVKGRWKVELNPEIAPKLRINKHYASLISKVKNGSESSSLKNHLQEARWFIKSLKSRHETLLKVSKCIVNRQEGFLDYGEEAMKPLVLHDIAEELSMHESTISRVTTQKYLHTPRGIFELKYFFSSHVNTDNGGECSATAIRALIKKLIAEESAAKPLSDSKIASILSDRGIRVARRTVAKYREAMVIPPSNERKRLA